MNSTNSYMTNIFPDSFADPMRRFFLPCKKIAASEKCSDPEIFINNRTLRNFVASDFPVCKIAEGGFIIADFGKEFSGGVRIVSDRMKPAKIRLRFGESLSECCGEPNMDHAIHDVVLPLNMLSSVEFGNTGTRFVRIDAVSGELNLTNIIAYAEMRWLEKRGSFTSSDPRLNAIFDTAVHTVHLNIQDFIFDGVKRDRLLWGGDIHPEIATILRVFGGIKEVEETLEMLCSHTAKGEFINTMFSYPLWVLIAIRDYWFYHGDNAILQKFASFITGTVERFIPMVKDDGAAQFPGQAFLDWPSSTDPQGAYAGIHALLATALSAADLMYKELGKEDAELSAAVAGIRRHLPDPGCNKAAAALQHLAGLADRRDILGKDPFHNISTFLGYYVLLAKTPASALELTRRYWGGMLDMGATSFWEDFDLAWCENAFRIDQMPVPGKKDIHADFGAYCYKGLRHSLCHGWASGPAAWCSEKILGVTPAAPGYRKIRFTPDLCDLDHASGTIPTIHGDIRVSLQKGKEPEIILPPEVTLVI